VFFRKSAADLLSFEMQPPYPSQVLCDPCVALLALLNNEPCTITNTQTTMFTIQYLEPVKLYWR